MGDIFGKLPFDHVAYKYTKKEQVEMINKKEILVKDLMNVYYFFVLVKTNQHQHLMVVGDYLVDLM
jgi:hypothetical protein